MTRPIGSVAFAFVLAACGTGPGGPVDAGPAVDLSARVQHEMTPEEVEDLVLDRIARDTAHAGLPEVVPTKVHRISLLGPGSMLAAGPEGPPGSLDTVRWAVDFEGVALCGVGCAATQGTYLVDDRTRRITAGEFSGEVPCPRC